MSSDDFEHILFFIESLKFQKKQCYFCVCGGGSDNKTHRGRVGVFSGRRAHDDGSSGACLQE